MRVKYGISNILIGLSERLTALEARINRLEEQERSEGMQWVKASDIPALAQAVDEHLAEQVRAQARKNYDNAN